MKKLLFILLSTSLLFTACTEKEGEQSGNLKTVTIIMDDYTTSGEKKENRITVIQEYNESGLMIKRGVYHNDLRVKEREETAYSYYSNYPVPDSILVYSANNEFRKRITGKYQDNQYMQQEYTSDGTLEMNIVTLYDEKKRPSSIIHTSADESYLHEKKLTYEEDRLTKEMFYRNGEFIWEKVYVATTPFIQEQYSYNNQGEVTSVRTETYNDQGQITHSAYTDKTIPIEWEEKYVYYTNGRLKEKITYNNNGEMTSKESYKYTYWQ